MKFSYKGGMKRGPFPLVNPFFEESECEASVPSFWSLRFGKPEFEMLDLKLRDGFECT
jgi:hypothetical protein